MFVKVDSRYGVVVVVVIRSVRNALLESSLEVVVVLVM